jgi:hypothetical protein
MEQSMEKVYSKLKLILEKVKTSIICQDNVPVLKMSFILIWHYLMVFRFLVYDNKLSRLRKILDQKAISFKMVLV